MADQDPNDSAQAIVDFVATELVGGPAGAEIDADSDLLASGLIDSLAIMRLVTFVEKSHGVSIHPADITIENFTTVRRIVSYLGSDGGADGRASDR